VTRAPGVYTQYKASGSQPIQGVGTAVAAFIGAARQGPASPVEISSWPQFTRTFGDEPIDGTYLYESVFGFFENGGTRCYVGNVFGQQNGDGPVAGPAEASIDHLQITDASDDGSGLGLEIEISAAPEPPAPASGDGDTPTTGGSTAPSSPPKIKVAVRRNGVPVFEQDDLSLTATGAIARPPAALKALVDIKVVGDVTDTPTGVATLTAPEPSGDIELSVNDFKGGMDHRNGINGLEAYPDITMVSMPDLWWAVDSGLLSPAQGNGLVQDISSFCSNMGERMAILDPPPNCNSKSSMETWWDDLGLDNPYATIYWPWIEVDSAAGDGTRLVPPSGHLAGVWSRNDGQRGVHKAPGNESIHGVRKLAFDPSDTEQGPLNMKGVNCLRNFRGRGIKVYGARTAAKTDQSWKYLNVRRYFNYLQESILGGTQWAVFEPNDHALWARIRRSIGAFLITEWRKGALFGTTPQEAFFIKCDADINTPETIDLGEVHCLVGVAPVKPAEFVIFTLSQLPSGTSTVTE